MSLVLNGNGIVTGLDSAGSSDLGAELAAKLTTPGAWTSFTPTVEGYTGTIGAVTINSCAYQQIGKLVTARYDVTFAPGTAATAITMTLPVTAVAAFRGSGVLVETAVTGWALTAINDTTARIFISKYDNGAPWSGAGNNRHVGTFIYEAA